MARTLEAYAPNSLSAFTIKVIVAGAVTETITMSHVAAEPGTWRGTIAQVGSNGEAKLAYYWNGSSAEAAVKAANISAVDGTTSYGRDVVNWNANWDAEVQSEVVDALEAFVIESGISASAALTNDTGTQLTTITLKQAIAAMLSGLAGALSGVATLTPIAKPAGKPAGNTRLSATITADGRAVTAIKVPD